MSGQGNHKIFNIEDSDFEAEALALFARQYRDCAVYREFADALQRNPETVNSLAQIPFLPVRFFKTHTVQTGSFTPVTVFESSGTTGMVPSRHLIQDLGLYEQSFTRCFELFYGQPRDWCILGLLPSYLERGHSSLVYMVNGLMRGSGHPGNGFYLKEEERLCRMLEQLEAAGQKTLLIGVSFALLDFAEQFPMELKHTVVMETGGMKGRRAELVREDLHAHLKAAFGLPQIHAEYGMTELLSQAYSKGEGLFKCPPWMRVLVREEDDPFRVSSAGSGTLNIIDLANTGSCAFIATDDAGILHPGGSFEVLGRVDGSDLRGCSLLVV